MQNTKNHLTRDELNALHGTAVSDQQLRQLFAGLLEEEEEFRAAVCDCLTELKQLPSAVIDTVIDTAKYVTDPRGLWALRLLVNHFAAQERTQHALAQALLAGTLAVKQEAAKGLSRIKTNGYPLLPVAVTALQAQLGTSDHRLQRYVQQALST